MHGNDQDDDRDEETARGPARRATLATVAKLAGYHVSTVSRVLNGSTVPGVRSASPAAAEQIRQIAREVGYVPNAQAAALRRQRTRLLGVVMARMADTVLATIYEGIERAAAGYGFQTLVTNSWDDPGTRRECIDVLLSHGVDAMILGDSPADGGSLDILTERGLPFVLVNRRAADHVAITCDDHAGGRMAAEHLLELGHVRTAVLAGLPYASNAMDRTQGFVDAYREAGHPIPRTRIVPTTFDTAGGRMGAERLLRARTRPTAIFAINDAAAIGVLGCLRDHGIEPGREVSVVGFNDIPMAAELTVPLTSVRSPMQTIGEQSVHTLMRVLRGEEAPGERLRPTLMARASSARVQSGHS